MNTSPPWGDIIAAAGLPPTTDTKGACDIIEAIEGKRPSEETVRRWDIPYRLRGRERAYQVDHVIAKARERFEQAPTRVAAVPRRRASKTGQIPHKGSPSP
jgi:hypothetical protein